MFQFRTTLYLALGLISTLEASRFVSVVPELCEAVLPRARVRSSVMAVSPLRVAALEPKLVRGITGGAISSLLRHPYVACSVSGVPPMRWMSTKALPLVDSDESESVSQTLKPLLKHPQVYGMATYDALFKYILSHTSIRPSFFHAFVPDLPIVSSERLDEHMNPIQGFQFLREFLHRQETRKTVSRLSGALSIQVVAKDTREESGIEDEQATAFLHEMVGRFEELRLAFPKVRYDGTMDFVCHLATGEYALVEMQVIPQDYWDQRALAYVAAFYGNQLSKGESWRHIRKVIGINILGGGRDGTSHWRDTPDQYVRHYKFQEQLHKPSRFIDGIELIQYSIMNAPPALDNQEQQDWITFFSKGAFMSEDDVKAKIKTPAVLEAFELVRLEKIPPDVREGYNKEVARYDNYSQYTQELYMEGREEGREEGRVERDIQLAKAWHSKGKRIRQIAQDLDQTEDWVRASLSSPPHDRDERG